MPILYETDEAMMSPRMQFGLIVVAQMDEVSPIVLNKNQQRRSAGLDT